MTHFERDLTHGPAGVHGGAHLTGAASGRKLRKAATVSDIDVSLILPLRDQETETAATVRAAARIVERVAPPEGRGPLSAEILALDQRSGDNTLSVLSLLHGQIPSLRTLQDVEPGQAIRRATRVARGAVWLVMDRPLDPDLGAWGVGQVLRGHRAAIIPRRRPNPPAQIAGPQ